MEREQSDSSALMQRLTESLFESDLSNSIDASTRVKGKSRPRGGARRYADAAGSRGARATRTKATKSRRPLAESSRGAAEPKPSKGGKSRPVAAVDKRTASKLAANKRAAVGTRDLREMGFSPISAKARQQQLVDEGHAQQHKPARKVKNELTPARMRAYEAKWRRELAEAIARSLETHHAEELMHRNIATRGSRLEDRVTPNRRRLISAKILEDDTSSDERGRGVGLGLGVSENHTV